MNPYQSESVSPAFSVTAVHQQLNKIFLDPLFAESKILQRFLTYIIREFMEGRSNRIKEYTIAVNVLDKPTHFNPQENGIVRIHAGRLRRALNHYYTQTGIYDEIKISIPKGKYIPVISDKLYNSLPDDDQQLNAEARDHLLPDEPIILAVFPFLCLNNHTAIQSFNDGLCLHLTEELMYLKDGSVITYQAVKSLASNMPDFREIAAALGANYIVSGSIQFLKGNLRVHVHMVKTPECKQLWSNQYERKLTHSNLFDVEDELSTLVTAAIKSLPPFQQHNGYPLRVAIV